MFQNKLILHYRLYSGIFIRNNNDHNSIESVSSYYPLLQFNNNVSIFKNGEKIENVQTSLNNLLLFSRILFLRKTDIRRYYIFIVLPNLCLTERR